MSKNRQNRNFTIPTTIKAEDKVQEQTSTRGQNGLVTVIEESPFIELTPHNLEAIFAGSDINEIAAVAAPATAANNRDLFYAADGRARTIKEVAEIVLLAEKDKENVSEEDDITDSAAPASTELTEALIEQESSTNEVTETIVEEVAKPFYESPVQEWTTEQLESYIKGEVDDISYNVLKAAITEHLIRDTKLDRAWNPQECKEFLEMGIVPAKTSKGAWKADVTRFARKPASWATQELESWALGEIKAEGVVTDAALALELKTRLALRTASNSSTDVILAYKSQTGATTETTHLTGSIPTTPTPATDVEAAKIEIAYAGLTKMNQTYIEETLKKYVEVVAPNKPITPERGIQAQKQLDNVIRYVINLEDPQGFKSGMDLILNFIRKHRNKGGVFDDNHGFRFTDGLNPQGGVQESHIKILTLFFIFADDNKEARSQYDIPSLVALFPVARQPFLLHYFQNVA